MDDATSKSKRMEDLLGYHLELDEPEDRVRIEATIADPAALNRARAQMQRALAPLDADAVEPPPADLVESVLRRVAESTTVPFPKPASNLLRGEEARQGRGFVFSLRDVVGVAAAILLFVGIFVPGYSTARRMAQKAACLGQMRVLGEGYAGYRAANADQMPFTGDTPEGTAWASADALSAPAPGNSRHLWALVKGRYVPVEAFICAGRPNDGAADARLIDAPVDFPDPRNNSYATYFAPRPWSRASFMKDQPLAADMNPMIEARRLLPDAPSQSNSRSHGHPGGQNVLRADGNALWTTQPTVDGRPDDIYRIEGVRTYTGRERPSSKTDVFLVP